MAEYKTNLEYSEYSSPPDGREVEGEGLAISSAFLSDAADQSDTALSSASYLYSYDSGDLDLIGPPLDLAAVQAASQGVAALPALPYLRRTDSANLRRRQVSDEAVNQRLLIDRSEVDLFEELGSGAFGSVYRGALWGLPCAVKTFKGLGGSSEAALPAHCYHSGWQEEFDNEVAALRTLRHPHCVQLMAFSKEPYSIVFEYMDMGSLESLLGDEHVRMGAHHILHVARCVASGLHYLHTQTPEMLHKDIKSANVLVGDQWRQVKLADFGLSVVRRSEDAASQEQSSFVTTVQFRAPEATSKHFTSRCDVYSYGIFLSELITRQKPYSSKIHHDNGLTYDFTQSSAQGTVSGALRSEKASIPLSDSINLAKRELVEGSTSLLTAVRDPEVRLRPALPRTNCPPWLRLLIQRCWAHDPEERPSMHDVLLEIEIVPASSASESGDFAGLQPILPRQHSGNISRDTIGDTSFHTVADSLAALKLDNSGKIDNFYVSKLENNYYCRMYNAVFHAGSERLALVIISKVVAMARKYTSGAFVLHRADTNQFYGLLLYADDEGLRASDALAARNQVLGDKMSNMCASPLFREVLEVTPVAVRSGAKIAHLTRIDIRGKSRTAIEDAIAAYQERMVPRLLRVNGWSGILAAAQYNENRLFIFNFFDSTTALSDFIGAGCLNEANVSLKPFIASPLSFETFDVVLQLGAGAAHMAANEAVAGARKVGYMTKEGGFIRNFKRRFFVLREHMLYYFEHEGSAKPLGAVALTGAHVEADSHNLKMFRIVTPRRKWLFQCTTAEDARDWIDLCLDEIIRTKRISE